MSRPHDPDWAALQQAISDAVARHVPGWTAPNTGDPGITLLQVFAFLLEDLVQREVLPEGAAVPVARVEHQLSQLGWRPSVEVSVDGERWDRVPTLEGAGSDARVFAIDETGAVVFGDGEHGRRPPEGSRVTVRFREGSGREAQETVAVQADWPLPARVRTVSSTAVGALRLDTRDMAHEAWSGLTRPRYVDGQLLTAADFRDEQEYHLRKHRRHQATLHGPGIVSGLRVEPTADRAAVTIARGMALDEGGREVYVPSDLCIAVPEGTTSPAFVVLLYAERLVDPAPIGGPPATAGDGESGHATRIEEGGQVLLSGTAHPGGVAIARLVQTPQGWRVDPSYDPPRTG